MQTGDSEQARFEIREELARDPRFVRRRAYDRRLECEVILEQPGAAVVGRLGTADGVKALREARMLARIQHPRVIRLREVVELDGLPTLVLDPMAGERLDAVLAARPKLGSDEVVRLGRQLAQAAQAVHAQGVVHRGIAPENVVIEPADGSAVLAGFTFAKPVDVRVAQSSLDHRLREKGGPAERGLPQYAAPEQIAGQPADHRADVFALGCLLYRCSTGRDAFPEDAVSYDAPPAPRELDRAIPRKLSDLIRKCIAHSPMARFPNMIALDEALAALEAAPAGVGKGKWIAGIAGIAAALVVTVVIATNGGGADDPRFTERGPNGDVPVVKQLPNLPSYKPEYSERRALLVGIDYEGNQHFAELGKAEEDVRQIATRLELLGWRNEPDETPSDQVRVLLGNDATERRILESLTWARSVGPDAQVLVYFAGHGDLVSPDPPQGYFIPADADDSRANWISLRGEVVPLLESKAGPKHLLVALDCCHSGAAIPVDRSKRRRDAVAEIARPQIEQEFLKRQARVLLTSALAHEKARDDSPFAKGFLSALDLAVDGKPVIASRIYWEIYEAVVAADAGQVCWRTDFHGGDSEFVFLPR